MNEPLFCSALPGRVYGASLEPDRIEGFTAALGDAFTLACTVRADAPNGMQVLFARGPKIAGHVELWLFHGIFAFFAPEVNHGDSILTGIEPGHGETHHLAFTLGNGKWQSYLDGALTAMGLLDTEGSVSAMDAAVTIGRLEDGSYPFEGLVSDIRAYDRVLEPDEIRAIATVKSDKPFALLPPEAGEERHPAPASLLMPLRALRGTDRLLYPTALPLLDPGAAAGYCGSIDKAGDNADWDWGIYCDKNNEWVLFEADGAGCLYNFTQHRYPSSPEPTFRFYLDDPDTPAFEIRQSEFGKKAPFLPPLAGIYQGPEESGRGPIWVIRSFVPMNFRSYCRVTSSVKLEGPERSAGQGGWGHVTYALYDRADGTPIFSAARSVESLCRLAGYPGRDPKDESQNETEALASFTVAPGAPVTLLDRAGAGSVASIRLRVEGKDAEPRTLTDLRLRAFWDGEETPSLDAPIGTFFGCEYGRTACDNHLMMLGLRLIPRELIAGENFFPMPFWEGARIELYTVGGAVSVKSASVAVTPESALPYDRAVCGSFVSSPYYEKAPNREGVNTRLAAISGRGHMVYGVLTGYGIGNGCEGDVRVFFDGRQSPEIESDGSESWASYGWGFVTPPQCNPFSAYNGAPFCNSDWSEVRLTVGDSYHFRHSLVFEAEHGGHNEGCGFHSGQIFCYLQKTPDPVTDSFTLADPDSAAAHDFSDEGHTEVSVRSAYANGLNMDNAFTGTVFEYTGGSLTFTLALDPENRGAVLIRTGSQEKKRQAAAVAVDGKLVSERAWYQADGNDIYRWRDDSFAIPASYTAGKDRITVTLVPVPCDGVTAFNAASFRIISKMP